MCFEFFSCLAENFDLPILDWISSHLHCPALDAIMPIITSLGNGGIIWILCAAVLLAFPQTRKIGLGIGFALIMGLLTCNLLLKPCIARIRPFDYQQTYLNTSISLLISPPRDYSFPSGHTIASFEAAVVIFLNRKKWGIPALILACLIAFSRLYLYVHYPTDVLAALILGTLFAFTGNALSHRCIDNQIG